MTAGGAAAAAELPLCPVCCETLGRWGGPATLPCGHNGCLDCFELVQQRNAQCPLCRASFGKELKLSCNHELEDLIRLATMLFVDESAKQDGWEAFPSTQLTADTYAAELIRGHQKANAAAVAAAAAAAGPKGSSGAGSGGGAGAATASPPPAPVTSTGPLGGFGLASLGFSGLGFSRLGFGGSGGGNGSGADAGGGGTLEDLRDIMTADPLAQRRGRGGSGPSAAGPGAAGRRRHSDGSSGGLGGSDTEDDDGDEAGDGGDNGDDGDWASSAPSAPALADGDLLAPGGSAAVGPAAGAGGGAGPLWDPLGSMAMVAARTGGAGLAGPYGGGGSAVLALEPPLWLPDSHASECLSCHMPFRPFTRLRHHCRLCGKIFCSACCHKRALLPPKYGVRTPQRVCELCSCALVPHQQLLAGTLAAAAQPPVQDSPDAISLRAWLNNPWTGSLGEDIFKSANMLATFVKAVHMQPEAGLPTAALQGAAGLALLTVVRVGAGWSLSFGTGLVVARTANGGWSAPCAISAAGLGWGLQLGGELADVLLVLRSREALSGLCGGMGAGVVVGGTAALAVGPVGRHADASVVLNTTGTAAAYGYSCSKGAFVGLSVESSLLRVRTQVNLDFYGYPVTPRQLLLEATVPPPPAAAMLYQGIKALLNRFECRGRLVHNRHTAPLHRLHSAPAPAAQQQQQQPARLPAPVALSPSSAPLLLPMASAASAPVLCDYRTASAAAGGGTGGGFGAAAQRLTSLVSLRGGGELGAASRTAFIE